MAKATAAVQNSYNYQTSTVRDFIALLKPRVMSLVVFTAFIGLYIAPGNIHPFIAMVAILCIVIGSGSAGAINMWLERDIDAKMERTKNRPLPAGRMNPDSAIEFAVIMAISSVFIMGIAVGALPALLLLSAITFYVFIYTIWLKPRTPQNIVIGGAAGALPPMIGWVSVTGHIDIQSIILFLIIFMWTPPHFWALSLYRCGDYTKAGIPMLPVVTSRENTQLHIIAYSLLLIPVTLLPYTLGMLGYIYEIGAMILGLRFLTYTFSLYKKYSEETARKTFKFSIMYLFVIFTLMALDKMILG